MSEEKYVQKRWLELLVAGLFGLAGAVVMLDSLRVGKNWAEDGPEAGYFPFYIACVLLLGAGVVIFQTVRDWAQDQGRGVFTSYEELGRMLKMLLPMMAYVLAVIYLGIYDASAIFIMAFMLWQGKYTVMLSALVGVGVAVALFLLFEVWFLVPLPKGPIEQLLGY